jgi:hypothetical protein
MPRRNPPRTGGAGFTGITPAPLNIPDAYRGVPTDPELQFRKFARPRQGRAAQ